MYQTPVSLWIYLFYLPPYWSNKNVLPVILISMAFQVMFHMNCLKKKVIKKGILYVGSVDVDCFFFVFFPDIDILVGSYVHNTECNHCAGNCKTNMPHGANP